MTMYSNSNGHIKLKGTGNRNGGRENNIDRHNKSTGSSNIHATNTSVICVECMIVILVVTMIVGRAWTIDPICIIVL